MKRTAMALLALAVLSSCETTATTTMLNERTALISARDEGWNDHSAVFRKVLQTAAEIGQTKGFQFFEIVGAQDATRYGQITLPGQSTTNTYGQATCTGYSCSGTATTNSSTMPAQTFPSVAPGADVTVRYYRSGEAGTDEHKLYSIAAILAQNPKK